MAISINIVILSACLALTLTPAFAEVVSKNRLDCIESLTPYSQKGASTSFKFVENVKAMNLKEFSSALIGIDKRKNLMTLPSTRNGERGVYLYADDMAFWYKLPKLQKKGEFLPHFLKIENKQIAKSPLFLTYYDGVESTGAEYSNKSVNLSLKNSESSESSAAPSFTNMQMAAIQDSESQNALLENFKRLLKSIHHVYGRSTEKSSPKHRKEITEKFRITLNSCADLFKQSGDKEYLELTKSAAEEFNLREAMKTAPDGTTISK